MQGRTLITALVVGVIAVTAVFAWRMMKPEDGTWSAYKERFIASDGRVVDTGNEGISHSEGQSYGMLLAVAHNDRATFDQIWSWTRQTLRRPDGLFSWRYVPNAVSPIEDRNNATDGDLVICWALLQSAKTWDRPEDRASALTIADALANLIVRDGEDAYLLPAVEGFFSEEKRIVNLSYWVFPALHEIAAATGDPVWNQVIATGLRLIENAKFGDNGLPPDWLETLGTLRPAGGFPPRFGYDAIRIPLYLAWSGHDDAPYLRSITEFWSDFGAGEVAPAWIDLTSGETSVERQAAGMDAVARMVLGKASRPENVQKMADEDYYSTSLLMLTALAEGAYGQP